MINTFLLWFYIEVDIEVFIHEIKHIESILKNQVVIPP